MKGNGSAELFESERPWPCPSCKVQVQYLFIYLINIIPDSHDLQARYSELACLASKIFLQLPCQHHDEPQQRPWAYISPH
jgi:hypothetical protein